MPRRPTPRWALAVAVGLIVMAVGEGASRLALRLLALKGVRLEPPPVTLSAEQRATLEAVVKRGATYIDHDRELGWSPRPLGESGLYRANAAGLRADREYPEYPPPGTRRIAALGDSFVHGDYVTFEDTWERQLETRVPRTEVLNFGVSAYGLDQAYLRYLSLGRRFHAPVVIVGFIADDARRATSTFRLFRYRDSPRPFAKPRFVVDHDQLRLVPNPFQSPADYERLLVDGEAALARLQAHDSVYQRAPRPGPFDAMATVRVARLAWSLAAAGNYTPWSEEFRLNLALFDAFVAAARDDGASVLLVFFPVLDDPRFKAAERQAPYAELVAALEGRGYAVLDTMPALREQAARSGLGSLFVSGHFSPLGNGVVATAIAERLAALPGGAQRDPVDQAGREQTHEAPQPAAQR